jgi:hypothetical protein
MKIDINKLFRLREYIESVSSTNVKKVKWDSVSKDLVIQFEDNSIYTYSNVPEAIYINVVDGQAGAKNGDYPSVGAAVHQYLINGGYQYRRGGTI